jgi:hypothetical protein
MADSNETGPTREDVDRRACEIYLERGGSDGDELMDWLQAEQEVNEEYAMAKAPTPTVPKSTELTEMLPAMRRSS